MDKAILEVLAGCELDRGRYVSRINKRYRLGKIEAVTNANESDVC